VPWFYATIYDRFMRKAESAGLRAWRRELIAPLAGEVLEVGAGTGANLEHYASGIDRLVLSEPERNMRERLSRRLEGTRMAAEVIPASSAELPFPDESFDAVVSTLVLCSVPDPDRSLAEIRRVLRPGGRFVFIEHVAAEDRPSRLRWQRRIEPLWVRLADGCHLTRKTDQSMLRAGFELETLVRESMRKALPFVRPSIRGVARKG
jgi:ubiquinone/menaquinone biosynthesis C-methylase UbiE